MQLNGMQCEVCQTGAPPISNETAIEFKKQIPDWRIIEECGVPRIERAFEFNDFASALDFTCKVGELAEHNGHHPAILTEWGKVTVQWWTHKICGLHMNDFIMAAKTDQLV
ncbi:MAG: 4a-hydroxytetrahydrobiopterin dehydratase [Kiritimatiellales bacterium]|nr:4a-hydroxytetrahydrobiopterin dehydratase [Kiritimatiellota bacterium]MBL7012459.1 4a-hydroxytetrahydrobiopterin dehydratase [Kiritimatiellales bacterium]